MGRKEYAANIILKSIGHCQENKVVEIGCNNFGRRISQSIIGLDVIYKHRPNIVADVCGNLPFRSKSLKAIIGIDIVEHIEDIGHFLEECKRVLGKGGRLSFAIPRKDIFGSEIKNIKKYGHKHMWNFDEWAILAESFGIETIKCMNLPGGWFFYYNGLSV